MKVPLLDIQEQNQYLKLQIREVICEIIDSSSYVLGEKVEKFESNISRYLNVKHAIGVSSATDALLLSLMAYDIGVNDLVITTPYSFVATAGVISRLGAKPVFIDINPDTYNICPNALESWFKNNKDTACNVKAIIPVHIFGQSSDMKSITSIASNYSIPVIEDAAQAMGSKYVTTYETKPCGTYGDIGCFSFYPSKNLGAMGDAGLIVTNCPKTAEKIKILRNHGSKEKYFYSLMGGNFRLDAIQAAILTIKLPFLDKWNKERQLNAEYYDSHLVLDKIKTPSLSYGRKHHIYHQYVISVEEKRTELKEYLHKNDIVTEIYYPVPLHLQKCFKYLGYKKGDLPKSEYASEHTLAIPVYPELKKEQREYVVEKILSFFQAT